MFWQGKAAIRVGVPVDLACPLTYRNTVQQKVAAQWNHLPSGERCNLLFTPIRAVIAPILVFDSTFDNQHDQVVVDKIDLKRACLSF